MQSSSVPDLCILGQLPIQNGCICFILEFFENSRVPLCGVLNKHDVCTTHTPNMLPRNRLLRMLIVRPKVVPIEVISTLYSWNFLFKLFNSISTFSNKWMQNYTWNIVSRSYIFFLLHGNTPLFYIGQGQRVSVDHIHIWRSEWWDWVGVILFIS